MIHAEGSLFKCMFYNHQVISVCVVNHIIILCVAEEVICAVENPQTVCDGKEEVGIVILPQPVDEPPYRYGILPSGTVFQASTKVLQTAYEDNKEKVKKEKEFNETKHMLKEDFKALNMDRIMTVCVAMHTKRNYSDTPEGCGTQEGCDVTDTDITNIQNQIKKTKLTDVMKQYYAIGIALGIQVNTPSTVLSRVKTYLLGPTCDMVVKGPQDMEMKAVHMLYMKKYAL
jgi:hypothetical protein